MPTALIADDEPLMRANLREHLHALWPELQILDEAVDGPEAWRKALALKPELAFLDIQMPGLTGLQVAQLLDPSVKVVFVTAFDRYALEAFDAHAVDYLLKPLDPARLAKLVLRLKQQQHLQQQQHIAATAGAQQQASLAELQALIQRLGVPAEVLPEAGVNATKADLDWLQVDLGKQVRMVHVDDVQYFESDSKYTRVVAADCDGLIRLSLKELLVSLDGRHYQQIHRSVVVNRRFIRGVHRQGEVMELELRGCAARLRVSEANQHLFRPM